MSLGAFLIAAVLEVSPSPVLLAAPTNIPIAKARQQSQGTVVTGQVGTATLGVLITVEGTVTKPVEEDLPYGYKVFVDDGSGAAQVYLNASTDIDPRSPWLKPGRKLRVTGFCNQYGDTYEVDPRFRRDLRPVR